jgi:fatty acid desaturase
MTGPPQATAPARRAPRPDRAASEFAELSRQIQGMGLLERRYGYYWTKIGLVVGAFAAVWVGFTLIGDSWFQLIVAAALAVVATQLAFLGHEAAHRQIFKSAKWNEWMTLVLVALFSGMSSMWWSRKHNKHHAAPNQEGRDPDIESSVLAFTPGAARAKGRVGSWLAARQGWFFFPLLLLEGLNLHAQSIKTLCARGEVKRRWVELSFITVRLVGYLAAIFLVLPPGKAAAFLGVQLGLFGLYMGCSFAPNHKGMPLVPESMKIDFLRRQVLMSRNITGGRFTTFALGGLNHQIEHHLFPNMPRPSLAKARVVVKQFCAERGVAYTETGLLTSYGIVVQYLNRVGLGHRDPFECPIVASYRPRG